MTDFFSLLRNYTKTRSQQNILKNIDQLSDYFYNIDFHLSKDEFAIFDVSNEEDNPSVLDYGTRNKIFYLSKSNGRYGDYSLNGIARTYSWRDDIRRKGGTIQVPRTLNDIDKKFFAHDVTIANLSHDSMNQVDEACKLLASLILVGNCYVCVTHSLLKSFTNRDKFLSLQQHYEGSIDYPRIASSTLSAKEIEYIDDVRNVLVGAKRIVIISLNRLSNEDANIIIAGLYNRLKDCNRRYIQDYIPYLNELNIEPALNRHGEVLGVYGFSFVNVDNPTKLNQMFGV